MCHFPFYGSDVYQKRVLKEKCESKERFVNQKTLHLYRHKFNIKSHISFAGCYAKFHSKEEGEKKMPCGSRKSCGLIGCTTPPLTAFLTGTRSSSQTWVVRSEKLLIPFSNFLMEVCRSWLEYSHCIDVIINSLRTFPQTELSEDRWTRLLWLALDTNYKLAHKRNMDNLLTSLEDLHRFLMRVCSYW